MSGYPPSVVKLLIAGAEFVSRSPGRPATTEMWPTRRLLLWQELAPVPGSADGASQPASTAQLPALPRRAKIAARVEPDPFRLRPADLCLARPAEADGDLGSGGPPGCHSRGDLPRRGPPCVLGRVRLVWLCLPLARRRHLAIARWLDRSARSSGHDRPVGEVLRGSLGH
jgi:hypothetical protein